MVVIALFQATSNWGTAIARKVLITILALLETRRALLDGTGSTLDHAYLWMFLCGTARIHLESGAVSIQPGSFGALTPITSMESIRTTINRIDIRIPR